MITNGGLIMRCDMKTAALLVLLPALALGNVYDVVLPAYEPSCTCLPWANAAALSPSLNLSQADVDAWRRHGCGRRGQLVRDARRAVRGPHEGLRTFLLRRDLGV